MQIAVYVRVSTQHQAQQQTIDQQLERLQGHIQAQDWKLPDERIFRDDGYSGASLKRPGLDRLRDMAASGTLDRVLVTAPDRLARKYVHQVLLIEELERTGCLVEFLDRSMSQDPHDQLLLQIRGAVAEYERSLIAERMRRGRQSKFRAGVLLPWTRAPYGYHLDPDHPRDPTGVRLEPAEAAIVAEIYAEYLKDGVGLIKVAKHLAAQHIPSPSGKKRWGLATLRAVLKNPAYTGCVYAGRTRSQPPRVRRSATHPLGHPHDSQVPVPQEEWIRVADIPAVVSQAQFDHVQAKLATNQSFASRHNTAHEYLLRALISCGVCQLACFGRTSPDGRNSYYICSGKAKPVQNRREDKCPSRFIPARQVDELVWRDLCDLLTHPETIADAMERALGGHWLPQELQARQENLRRGRASLEQQLNRLTEAYLSGVIPLAEYHRRRQDTEQHITALENQTRELANQADRQKELAGLVTHVDGFCQRIQAGLGSATFEQRRQLVELLVDRVIVTNGDVEIRYAIPTTSGSEHIRFCHLRTDYFRTPHLVRAGDHHVAQQVRVHNVLSGPNCCALLRIDGLQIHHLHQPAHPLTIDRVAPLSKEHAHPWPPVEWRLEILLVDQTHQVQIQVTLASRPVVERRAIQPHDVALPADTQKRIGIDHGTLG
jgi:site-specific DNA recombinase